MLGTILLIVLIVALIGAVPVWPYSSAWGYRPIGILGVLLLLLLILFLLNVVPINPVYRTGAVEPTHVAPTHVVPTHTVPAPATTP